jgi:hypothetical protein
MKSAIVWAIFAATLVASFAALGVSGQANLEAATARSKITTLEQVWARALASGDLKALDALSDPNLIFIDSDGSLLTKPELLSYAKSAHPQRVISGFTKIQVFDDTAVVNGSYQSKELRNQRSQVQQGVFTDTWLYKDSNWVCIAAQITPILAPAN